MLLLRRMLSSRAEVLGTVTDEGLKVLLAVGCGLRRGITAHAQVLRLVEVF